MFRTRSAQLCSGICFVLCNSLHIQFGWSPLISASKNGHKKVIELLISAGANVNGQDQVNIYLITHTHLHSVYMYAAFLVD